MKLFYKGDTLIEVIIAISIFGVVAIAAINVMVQGVASTQRSLEITIVRQEIDAQTAALRFLHNAFVASYKSGVAPIEGSASEQWSTMMKYVGESNIKTASKFGPESKSCPSTPLGSFILNTRKAKVVTSSISLKQASLYAKTNYDINNDLISSEGIWIEAVSSPTTSAGISSAGYVDFHIRACWITSGRSTPSTLGTIVRLYEPRN